jgi:HEPN domain-containing protein
MQPESMKWVNFAREDLTMAGLALDAKLFNQTCFHAQQCCEKCLKALAHEHKGTPPKTHKLADLLTLLGELVPTELADRIRTLDRFYIPTRYPDALPGSLAEGLPNQADAIQAKGVAAECFCYLLSKAESKPDEFPEDPKDQQSESPKKKASATDHKARSPSYDDKGNAPKP